MGYFPIIFKLRANSHMLELAAHADADNAFTTNKFMKIDNKRSVDIVLVYSDPHVGLLTDYNLTCPP